MISELAKARFWSKVSRSDGDRCWPWTGGTSGGYGSFNLGRRTVRAHRLALELAKGPLADDLVARHRCDNPICCNPAHLEPGTHLENMQDMFERGRWGGAAEKNSRLTHCLRGHEFTPANTHFRGGTWRICRQCNRDKQTRLRSALAAFTAAEDGACFIKKDGELIEISKTGGRS